MIELILEDAKRYRQHYRFYALNLSFIFVMLFRICRYLRFHRLILVRIIGYVTFLPIYYFLRPFLGIQLPLTTSIGGGLLIYHYGGIVINAGCHIGKNLTVRQNCTLGNRISLNDVPVIGNNVELGANCCILGAITIGDNVTIGAGAVVIDDVEDNQIAVGSRARVLSN